MRDEKAKDEKAKPEAGGAKLDYSSPPPARAAGPRFFTIYKAGQGYWTRMGTALGAALIAFLCAQFVYGRLQALKAVYGWQRLGVAAMFAISVGVFACLM